jgi:hypothetical protein
MLHRIITRLASALLVTGLLAAPATAGAKAHHKTRHVARHKVVKHKAVSKSLGRIDQPQPPTEPTPQEASQEEPSQEPEPTPQPDPVAPAAAPDAGSVVSFHEGVLDVALGTGGDVVGTVIPGGTLFACRSAATHEPVVEGCNASLLTPGAALHEFAVNYGSQGAWFQRIIIVLP